LVRLLCGLCSGRRFWFGGGRLLSYALFLGNDVFRSKSRPLWLGGWGRALFARFLYLASSGPAGTADGDNKQKDAGQKAQCDGNRGEFFRVKSHFHMARTITGSK
jgi:hypothetical protein